MCRFHAFFLKWKTNCNFGFEACGIIRTISQLEDGNLICNISRCLVVAMMCFFASTNTCIYIYSISSAFDYGERNCCWTLSTLYLHWDLLVLLVSFEFVSDHTALTHTHIQTPILVVRRVKIILSIFAYLFSTLSVFPLISSVCSFCILIKILNCPHLRKLNVNTQKEQIKSRGKKSAAAAAVVWRRKLSWQ